MSKTKKFSTKINSLDSTPIICFSDIHAGCRMGLISKSGAHLDDGGVYLPSTWQTKLTDKWDEFWLWAKKIAGDKYRVVNGGDSIDGVHHKSTTQISHRIDDQLNIAREIVLPAIEGCAAYYHVRGTDAHVGSSGNDEETLARELGAVPDEQRRHAQYELNLRCGNKLVNVMHHISTSSSLSYIAGAVNRELTNAWMSAVQWNLERPDILIRGHRHQYSRVDIPSSGGIATALSLPGWQGKTPYVYRVACRTTIPQFGGIVLTPDGGIHVRVFSIS